MSLKITSKPSFQIHRFEKTVNCIHSILSIHGRDICNLYESIDRSLPDGTYLAYVFKSKEKTYSHVKLLSKEFKNSKIMLALPVYLLSHQFCPCEELTVSGGKYCVPAFNKLLNALELGQMYEVHITSNFQTSDKSLIGLS